MITNKTTFTITLDSIIQHYVANMLKWLQDYSKDDLESSIGELDSFSANAKDLSRRNVNTIERLFESGFTHMLLSEQDFDTIEQAEIDNENWEILVVVEFNKELVRIPGKVVGW